MSISKKAVLLASLLACASAAPAAAAPWVAGYYAGWEQSHLPITSVDMTSMDALIHFAVVPNADGSLNASINGLAPASVLSVVSTVHAAGKKVLFTVGGAGSQAGFQGAMAPAVLPTFVNNIASFMTTNGYDGVDIDMEAMGPADDAPYIAFAKALRTKLTAVKPGSLLTAAVVWEPAAFAQLTGTFDHIDLMTYSIVGGTWYNETWHDAAVYSAPAIGGGSLASVDSMVKQFVAAGIPAASLGVGVTFDPYVWTGGSGVTKPQQTWTSVPTVAEAYYYNIAKTYGLVEGAATSVAGTVYGWDATAQASYLSVTGTPASADAFISYDDVSAIKAKFAYAAAKGIGSVIVWDLAAGFRTDLGAGQQDLLLQAVKSAAYGGTTVTPPAAPVISALSVSGLGQTAATVSWSTDLSADGQVAYGLTSAYGATTTLNATLTTSHSAALSSLNSGTLYHYAVMSRSAAGVLTTSADATFTTSAAVIPPSQTGTFTDDFSSYALNTCLSDGAAFGGWTSAFSGYGCTSIKSDGTKFWLDESPYASASSSETHASLVLGPSFTAPITFTAKVETFAQLRQNAAPNAWEVGWVFWDYTDNTHFYYFQAKPNGWELGKEDPAYTGAQRFLATGSTPVFPVGSYHAVKVVQAGSVITVYVDGALLTTFTDAERPYSAGRIGLYNEDSNVRFEDVTVNETPAVVSAVAVSGLTQSAAAIAWTTNEPADAQVQYGPTSAYGSTTVLSAALTASHSASVSGLTAGTAYHYAVMSRDLAGDRTVSADATFVTLSTGAAPAPPPVSPSAAFADSFSAYAPSACFSDGTAFGSWTSAFSGFGCTSAKTSGSRAWLDESPLASTSPAQTHSALVLGPSFTAPLTLSVTLDTYARLRMGTAPNPWEVAAVAWDYADASHYYYFQPKPDGWELGKKDPAYPGSQRYLATGTSPAFPTGAWYIVKIVQTQNTITVLVNGRQITSFVDTERPYTAGSIGLYTTDAASRFKNVAVNSPAGAAPSVAVAVPSAPASVTTVSGTTNILAATANDAAVTLVQFLLDGVPLGAAVDTPPFTLSWNTAGVAPGVHALSALAWDALGDISVSASVPIVISATLASTTDDQAKAPQKFLTPASADGVNDTAVFGLSAAEVTIYDLKGHQVFHGSNSGGSPIVWDCKDGSGRVRGSGVYIAKIRKADSGVLYQSFALVR
jgi:GH18 family chitinase